MKIGLEDFLTLEVMKLDSYCARQFAVNVKFQTRKIDTLPSNDSRFLRREV